MFVIMFILLVIKNKNCMPLWTNWSCMYINNITDILWFLTSCFSVFKVKKSSNKFIPKCRWTAPVHRPLISLQDQWTFSIFSSKCNEIIIITKQVTRSKAILMIYAILIQFMMKWPSLVSSTNSLKCLESSVIFTIFILISTIP